MARIIGAIATSHIAFIKELGLGVAFAEPVEKVFVRRHLLDDGVAPRVTGGHVVAGEDGFVVGGAQGSGGSDADAEVGAMGAVFQEFAGIPRVTVSLPTRTRADPVEAGGLRGGQRLEPAQERRMIEEGAPERIAKRLARAGVASRRVAEKAGGDGYLVVRGLYSPEEIAEMRGEFHRLVTETEGRGHVGRAVGEHGVRVQRDQRRMQLALVPDFLHDALEHGLANSQL